MTRRLLACGAALLLALPRWVTGRRPGLGPEDQQFGYTRAANSMSYVMLFVTVVEGAVLAALIPWPLVRLLLMALHGLLVALTLGVIAAGHTRPHLVGPERVRIRQGALFDLELPVRGIATASAVTRYPEHGMLDLSGDQQLTLPVAGQTNVLLELSETVPATTPLRGVHGAVRHVACYADDAPALVRAVRMAQSTPQADPTPPR